MNRITIPASARIVQSKVRNTGGTAAVNEVWRKRRGVHSTARSAPLCGLVVAPDAELRAELEWSDTTCRGCGYNKCSRQGPCWPAREYMALTPGRGWKCLRCGSREMSRELPPATLQKYYEEHVAKGWCDEAIERKGLQAKVLQDYNEAAAQLPEVASVEALARWADLYGVTRAEPQDTLTKGLDMIDGATEPPAETHIMNFTTITPDGEGGFNLTPDPEPASKFEVGAQVEHRLNGLGKISAAPGTGYCRVAYPDGSVVSSPERNLTFISAPEPAPKFEVGAQVEHPTYGRGELLEDGLGVRSMTRSWVVAFGVCNRFMGEEGLTLV